MDGPSTGKSLFLLYFGDNEVWGCSFQGLSPTYSSPEPHLEKPLIPLPPCSLVSPLPRERLPLLCLRPFSRVGGKTAAASLSSGRVRGSWRGVFRDPHGASDPGAGSEWWRGFQRFPDWFSSLKKPAGSL